MTKPMNAPSRRNGGFYDKEVQRTFSRNLARPVRRLGRRSPASQRPEIEKHQNRRQGNEHGLGQKPQTKEHESKEVACERGPRDVAHIRHHGQQPEERAQHVLAFRDPGDRFHAQRMQGEQPGHQSAARPNDPVIRANNQNTSSKLAPCSSRFVRWDSARARAPHGPVKQKRHPGHRHVKAGIEVRPCPGQALPR